MEMATMTLYKGIMRRLKKLRKGERSYAQCGEDMIANFLFDCCGVQKGVYLDIGANHPSELNNTYYFYKKGWRGFNVDPLASSIRSFNRTRPRDINIAAGIGGKTCLREFYRMSPPTLSTFYKEVADSYCKMGHVIEEVTQVQFLSSGDLVERYKIPRDLDILSVDIEGGEIEVIEALVKAGVRPKALICETADYGPDLRSIPRKTSLIEKIQNLGFKIYADTYINTVFVDVAFWNQKKS